MPDKITNTDSAYALYLLGRQSEIKRMQAIVLIWQRRAVAIILDDIVGQRQTPFARDLRRHDGLDLFR